MCDILVVTPKASWNKIMIFAKNSDREPNEAQIIEYIPRMKHEEDIVKLTNIEYPQVKETYAILISRPWRIYGAEMGVNEYGLAIVTSLYLQKSHTTMKECLEWTYLD